MKKILIIVGIIVAISIAGAYGFRAYTKMASPADTQSFNQNGLSIEVHYSQPSKKGRVIFNGLVPYNKVWRTGANEATEISFNRDVSIAGQPLKAGTYTLFTIPGPQQWTIIFNSELGQWGDYSYQAQKDVLRVQVPSVQNATETEMFSIRFAAAEGGADMQLMWDKTLVAVPIR